ncbi:hypothetical protein DYY67_2163 [Candidatus Nitrosotalea sp. TS]|uniref:hypothetical protein n=1 Tax=Candidatus Nitrosotalea sp. TS TaxID=2341020 RepID=UPI00140E4765|nr:hypothetical protein [Candidatus Nitrosotalea sp. TS]NHI03986.1 hypothetical protein [Candidatus Nitrosotalea sp. TS]
MYKGLTIFRIALIAIIIGSIWIGMVFSYAVKDLENFNLDKLDSANIPLVLYGNGIGFYEISSNQYNNSILVKVLDSNGNYLNMKTITNKETVNYFVFQHTGKFTLELTNLSANSVQLTVEFGDTKYQEFLIPSLMILVGACLLMFTGYTKLRNYMTAQPE